MLFNIYNEKKFKFLFLFVIYNDNGIILYWICIVYGTGLTVELSISGAAVDAVGIEFDS